MLRSFFSFFLIMCFFLNFAPKAQSEELGPFLVLENPTDSGMFAVFSGVLGALHYYESGHFAGLKVDFNSGRYLDTNVGPNWWNYFFEPIDLGEEQGMVHVFSFEESLRLALEPISKEKSRAYSLIQRYIHLKPEIQETVNTFVNENFKKSFVIGVHHRGTDKVTEWALVPYEKTYRTLKAAIRKLSKSERKRIKVYVATDDQHFLDFLRKNLKYPIVCQDFARSTTSTALHAYEGSFYSSSYQMGREALLDCLMLAECDILIRPANSCLSNASQWFNPWMEVINLSG